ncbi:hypothetical protein EVAR_91336_1 [Eumeta japonica]|uniref:Uncharacterized protein n=1 Tax=Eumeta variegata TaxID=151549 RepID=A0A4C1T015_EUMVA|nr:hypothetical protein EVAR_91336_1 [Eumeta japonica]
MRHGADVLPGYKHITQAKINSRPLRTEFTEDSAKANLQDLMDHTAKRLLESLPENEVEILPEKLTLISKWGCDGSSGQSVYKQGYRPMTLQYPTEICLWHLLFHCG